MNIRNYIMSQKSINLIMYNGSVRPIPVENPLYPKLKELLDAHKYEQAIDIVDLAGKIKKHSSGLFYVVDGVVFFDSQELPLPLSNRLIQFADQDLDVHPLIAFWNNLKQNPSLESVKDLYGFLEHNDIPLTVDGCFVAYKRVKEDFFDCHTGKFDNHPGQVVKMNREEVDADRNVTCSSGLHVAAFNYAHNFYANGKLMEVKVNPRDVVAVPTDYENEKLRCCEYFVVRECEGRRENEALYTEDDSYNDDDDTDLYYRDDDGFEEIEIPSKVVKTKEDESPILNPDGRGRICIPAALVRKAGFESGQVVYVLIKDGEIKISGKKDINWKAYSVDAHNNLRVGRCLTNSYIPSTVKNNLIILQA